MSKGNRSKGTKAESPSPEEYAEIVKGCRRRIGAAAAYVAAGKYMRLLAILESLEEAGNEDGITLDDIHESMRRMASEGDEIPQAVARAAREAVKNRLDYDDLFTYSIAGRRDNTKFNHYLADVCTSIGLGSIYTLQRPGDGNCYRLLRDRRAKSGQGAKTDLVGASPAVPVNFSKLPLPTEGTEFVGRDEHKDLLKAAKQVGCPRIVQFFGFGGFGKSTIVWHWLNQRENTDGSLRQGLGWSFFSQGQDELSGITSSDFLSYAVRHFSQFPGLGLAPASSGRNLEEVGQAVADAFMRIGGVMVLDGVETLQYPQRIQNGRVRDPGLASLLRRLKDHASIVLLLTGYWS